MAIDIKTIARRARTSAASVSFVLNNKWRKRVRPEVARRIKRVAKRYNYTRSSAARGLALKRRFRIALCIQGFLTEHPIIGAFSFHELLSAVTARANRKGYALDIIQVEAPFLKNLQNAVSMSAANSDGLLFLGWTAHSIRRFLRKLKLSQPYIAVDSDLDDVSLCYAYTDMAESTGSAISYFTERGHRRIAFVRGEASYERFSAKLKGYRDVLSRSCIAYDPRLVFNNTKLPLLARGYRAGQKLSSMRKMPGAIFCSDNMCALGLLSSLKERGVKVPRDVEIIGFGDSAIANLCIPVLSYVKRPVKEMALACIERLLKWVEKEEQFKPVQIKCKEQLLFQGTTRRRGEKKGAG